MFFDLFRAVLILFVMIIPGFVMRKLKLAGDTLPLGFANTILYITQPAMLVVGFWRARDLGIIKDALVVLVLSFLTHILFLLAVKLFYKGADKERQKVYRFGTVFSNAGYMGIPLIEMAVSEEATIYASIYLIAFNFFCWSYGALIYSEDKSYISPFKMFVNAATIPTLIGIIIFATDFSSVIPTPISEFVYDALTMLKNTVAPMSMMIIGMRLADLKLKGAFKDAYMYLGFALRLLVFPLGAFGLIVITKLIGLETIDAFKVVLICSATPVASATSMFAEKFHSDTVSASKFVSFSTVLSLATMPLMALLLDLIPYIPSLI
jgi:predicted permease